ANPHVHVLVSQVKDASFPSDHAAAGFAIAGIVFLRHRRLGLPLLLFGLVMDYARVFVGVHYPGDVLAGTAIGLVSAAIAWYGGRAVLRLVVARGPRRLAALLSGPQTAGG
ncbi:MAG: phosphatase PAP2 family protein, partial [Candidatus Dormiibacterota bacterium]